MATLASILVSDASSVFLNTDDFAESCILYPGGDPNLAETFTGQVFRDDEEGTREVLGDGVVRDQDGGDRLRRSITIDCLATVGFDDTRDPRDKVKVGTETFVLIRIMGRDSAMQRVRCARVDILTDFFPRR